jgi:diguanylate cyclase (GGDEF)-like protein/PAS domain S-box-containing protein
VQDTKLRTVLLNDAARRVFDRIGLSPDRFEAELRALKVIDERGRALTFEELPQVRVLKTRQAIDSAVLGVMSPTSHRMIWLKLSVQPRLDQQTGQVQQIITAFSDVSELKRSSELFDEAQRLASAGGFEYDMVDEVLFFTEHTYRLFGLDPSKPVIARELLNLMRGSDRERAKAALYNFLREPQSVDLELRVALNGGTGWIRVLARPQLNDGKILRVTGIVRDITAQKNEEERLKRQAEQDALTGLVNRDSFLTALRQAIEATRAQGTGPAVLFVDLDRFKVLNDLLGHAAGDRLIAACGQRLRNNVPTSCLVARIGADEFAVLVPEARSEDLISQVAERIHRAFQRGFVDRGEDFLITASIGLARHPVHGESAEDLLRHADAAMQDAKRRGRNRWLPFSAALADSLKRELLIETQLRKALESHELRLVYQPKLDLASSRVIGAEALLRWRSKVLGDMSPEIFIPHAETTGDIVQIGQFVLREACRQLGDWRRQGLKLDHVAVNVSYRQFLSERFEGDIADALLDQGLDGSSLELELTERALIEDSPEVLETVAALRRLGVGLCIDDFGEGYSALGLLRKFQVQGLKISHKFMHGIPHHPVDTKLCEVIVQMARALDVKVTAEGVENQQQWRFLSALGAQYGQGFLFARPLEVEDFEAYLRANSS